MELVLAQHGRGMALADDEDAVEELAADAPTKRSAITLTRGARFGVLIMRTSIAVKTVTRS
jgi:hypothetical protein